MVPITYDGVIAHLSGVDQWLAAAAASTANYDQARIERQIPAWIRDFERKAQFRVMPIQIVGAPDGTYEQPVAGVGTVSSSGKSVTGVGTQFTALDAGMQIVVGSEKLHVFDITDDTHMTLYDAPRRPWSGASWKYLTMPVKEDHGYPYYPDSAMQYLTQTLYERPVRTIQRMRAVLNGKQVIFTAPAEWLEWDESGRTHLLPLFSGSAIVKFGAALVTLNLMPGDSVPNFFFFDYIAGLPDGWQNDFEWYDLRLNLEAYCALQILNFIDKSFGAGLTNKTISTAVGTQTLNYDRFASTKQELQAQFDLFLENFKAQQTPFVLDIL